MIARIAYSKAETGQDVTEAPPPSETPQVAAPKEEFESWLRGLLQPDQADKISEEALFAGLVKERIAAMKGDEASGSYQEALDRHRALLRKPDGFVPEEDAALAALKEITTGGILTSAEGDSVYTQAFSAAQLDGNKDVLFDSRGGPGDPTMAVEAMDAALTMARAVIEKFADGTEPLNPRSLATAQPNAKPVTAGAPALAMNIPTGNFTAGEMIVPNGTTVDGDQGFLFKPVSVNQGTLAVLLPAQMTGNLEAVLLRDKDGNEVERGTFTSINTAEGNRTKWSFSMPGGSYPADLMVEAYLSDGTMQSWKIPDPSQRYD